LVAVAGGVAADWTAPGRFALVAAGSSRNGGTVSGASPRTAGARLSLATVDAAGALTGPRSGARGVGEAAGLAGTDPLPAALPLGGATFRAIAVRDGVAAAWAATALPGREAGTTVRPGPGV
jgi:hypothetical protein